MKTVYFRIVLAALAAGVGAAAQAFPAYAGILQAIAAFVGGIALPAEAVQKAVKLAPKAVAGALLCFVLIGTSACANGLPPVVISVLQYVQDAEALLQALRAAYQFFLSTSAIAVPADTQAKIEQAFQAASLALDTAVRATNGVSELTQAQQDAAFSDFKAAWTSLVGLLEQLGAVRTAASGALLATHGSAQVIRVPLALR